MQCTVDRHSPELRYGCQVLDMTANKLQLNDNKTEALIRLSNRISVHSPLPSVIHIGDADVPFVSSVKKNLDSNLSMSQHISNTCKAAYIQIRHNYKFHTTPPHHSSNPNPCMLYCPLSLRILYFFLFRLPALSTY